MTVPQVREASVVEGVVAGVPTDTVDAYSNSKTCSCCGECGYRQGRRFRCTNDACDFILNEWPHGLGERPESGRVTGESAVDRPCQRKHEQRDEEQAEEPFDLGDKMCPRAERTPSIPARADKHERDE